MEVVKTLFETWVWTRTYSALKCSEFQTRVSTEFFINWCMLQNVSKAESNRTIGKLCTKEANRKTCKKHCTDDAVRIVSALFEKRVLNVCLFLWCRYESYFKARVELSFSSDDLYCEILDSRWSKKICNTMYDEAIWPADKLSGTMWGRNWNRGWCIHKRRMAKWECMLQFAKEMKMRWTLATDKQLRQRN